MIEEGTIIHGTLRTDDLLEAFTSELERIAPELALSIVDSYRDPYDYLAHNEDDTLDRFYEAPQDIREEADYLVNEVLPDALNNHAPNGLYFGTHPGDGSDFGFWRVEEEEV